MDVVKSHLKGQLGTPSKADMFAAEDTLKVHHYLLDKIAMID